MRMSPTKFRIAQNFPGREQLSPLQPMVMGSSSPETGQLPLKYVWKRITVWFPSRYVISVLYKYIQCIHHSFFVCTFTRLPPTQKKKNASVCMFVVHHPLTLHSHLNHLSSVWNPLSSLELLVDEWNFPYINQQEVWQLYDDWLSHEIYPTKIIWNP